MVKKIYGINYALFITGSHNRKLFQHAKNTEVFTDEVEFLKTYISLKQDISVGDICLFVSDLTPKEYIINK